MTGRPKRSEHGSQVMYVYHGCRCDVCRLAYNFYRSARDPRTPRNQRSQPTKTEAWREAVENGTASELCDRIIRERPFPDRLAAQLGRLP